MGSTASDNCQNIVNAIKLIVLALGRSGAMRLLQLSCGIHTSNLVLPDLRAENSVADAYVIWLKSLMSFLHTARVKRQLSDELREKMPMIQDAKWNSFIRASRWVHVHWDAIKALVERIKPELISAFRPEFELVHAALMPLLEYIESAEADNVTQQAFYCMKRKVKLAWRALPSNPFAAALDRLIDKRFVETGDGTRCELAFWLTSQGHAEHTNFLRYRSWAEADVPEEIRPRVRETCAAFARVKAKLVADAGVLLPSADLSEIGAEFARYVQDPESWKAGASEFDFWPERRWNGETPAAKQFASIAEVLTQLPASEAAAERLFSVFVWLFNLRRLRADIDLVEAEMIIRMWQVYHPDLLNLPLERCTRG